MLVTEDLKIEVWIKGGVIPNFSPAIWRWDACGAVIRYDDFGDRESEYGWEIDHIIPEIRNGSDHITNLQPLHWENNASKGDGPLVCARP